MNYEQAQRECDELDAMYAADAAADTAAYEALRDPAEALRFLVEAHGGDDCDGECPVPVQVLEVLSARTGGTTSVKARVVCADGATRVCEGWYSYCGGSMEEPPSQDAGFDYVTG